MIFSKSFGYALRGVLYITFRQDEARYVQVEEVASSLAAPKHFMGKILKRLAKEKILDSSKGPNGGFRVNANTQTVTLMKLAEITSDLDILRSCVLQFKECTAQNPCPLHNQMEETRNNLASIMAYTTVHNLMMNANNDFVGSISSKREHKKETID
jgi:Rrf2 family iron-sulfur cluster assembly transcriptional regulator